MFFDAPEGHTVASRVLGHPPAPRRGLASGLISARVALIGAAHPGLDTRRRLACHAPPVLTSLAPRNACSGALHLEE